jgi:hypothetical protein
MDFDSSPPPPPPPREPGRARQRIQQRRQERSQTTAREPRRRASVTQLAPTGGFKLPKLNITRTQLVPFSIVGAVLFIAVIVVVLGRVRNDEPELPPNALWIGEDWTQEPQSEEAVTALANDLRSRRIGTVYAWVSWLQGDLTWNNADQFGRVREFVAQLKAVYPELQLLAWIAVPLDAGQGYRIDSPDVQTQVAQLSQTAVQEFEFDGVFIDVPIFTDDENFLALLRRVRSSLGESDLLAAAVMPDLHPSDDTVPASPQIAPGTEWSFEFKQSVVLLLDQIAIMAFYSNLTNADDYTQWTAYQVTSYIAAIEALGADMPTVLIVAMPTIDPGNGHDPAVENIASAAAGIRAGMEQAGELASFVRGAGIYADYTTDDEEWAQFASQWVR